MAKQKEKEDVSSSVSELGKALVEAIELTRPMQKKTILDRKKAGPFASKDGTPKPRLRRTHYQHAIKMSEDNMFPEEIALLNKIRPGVYCDGNVKVILRKDRGIDIDYPVKTASQRLRLVNQYGITGLPALLKRIIEEQSRPAKTPEELDSEG